MHHEHAMPRESNITCTITFNIITQRQPPSPDLLPSPPSLPHRATRVGRYPSDRRAPIYYLLSSRRRRVMPVPDDEECLLQWVNHRLLTTAEKDARRLRRINAKQLRLGIEQSEREAAEAAVEAARVAKLKRKQDRVVRCLQGYIIIFDSSSNDGSNSDVNPPPAVDVYLSAGDPKGKGPAKKR